MKPLLVLLLLSSLAFLVGCTRQARLYDLATGKVYVMTYTGAGGRGKLSTTLESGEHLNGEWSASSGASMAWGNVYSTVYTPSGIVSGTGNANAIAMPGSGRGAGILTGDKGTVLDCEFAFSNFSGHGNGACKDNYDKKYKLMF